MRVANRTLWALLGVGVLAVGLLVADKPKFAQDRNEGEKTIEFNKERALGYLKQICDLGPRISGSEAMAKQQEIVKKHLEGQGAKVEFQKYTARQRSQQQPVAMANLVAKWYPERPKRILLGAHYDTRPIADREPDRRNWRNQFLGANDGAAGAALMMELAHHIGSLPTTVGIDFVLFDGEEYIFDNRHQDEGGDIYFFGSEHFAQDYTRKRANDPRSPKYIGAIVVDMIAGKEARFFFEQNSYMQAGQLAEGVWKIARDVGADGFRAQMGSSMLDDHIPLLKARIPTIDVIDADYPHWHRLTDVPANCSGETMEQVARVLIAWMQRSR
jgi:glutaminyl-peptide cyclotransferase